MATQAGFLSLRTFFFLAPSVILSLVFKAKAKVTITTELPTIIEHPTEERVGQSDFVLFLLRYFLARYAKASRFLALSVQGFLLSTGLARCSKYLRNNSRRHHLITDREPGEKREEGRDNHQFSSG